VAVMGFSAGGHLCADVSARFDAQVYEAVDEADAMSARPLCSAPIYPVVSMSLPHAHMGSRERLLGPHPTAAQEAAYSPHLHVPDNPPPHFLCHAEDDPVVPVANTLLLREAVKARGGRVETHLFEQGGHGFGLRLARGKPVEIWPELWLAWARTTGLFV
jgi:acetyl esterase/lipase